MAPMEAVAYRLYSMYICALWKNKGADRAVVLFLVLQLCEGNGEERIESGDLAIDRDIMLV